MEIKRGNTVLCDVYLKDSSYVTEEIMGEHTLSLSFLSRHVVDLEINDYVEFEGNIYTLRHNEKVVKRETSLGWEYSVTFYASKYTLEDVVFFLNGKPEFKKNFDYYTGTAADWLNLLVKNMNRDDSGWQTGSCIESEWITLSFKDKSVGGVLDDLVKQLKTEYWISGKTINLGRRVYESEGLRLGQGEGMGFTELEISAVEESKPTTVIYPYGSDKNLCPGYGADYLLLPGGQTELTKNVEKYGRLGQKKIPFDHIYPKGEFIVTEKIDTCTLRASGIDFNLKECLLDGVEAIVTFQDGGLAGYDLAIVEGSWDNERKQFKLKVNEQENALTVPGDINFEVGDKFILTGLKMPQSYIDKASAQLLEEATAWLDEHAEKRIQLRGKCDEVIFRLQNLFISCGQMVGIVSEELGIDREIRVTKVKRYIENDGKPCYRYELTLSDFLQGNGFKDMVDDVEKVPTEIEGKVKPIREWTKRSWRDVMETLGMMFDPEGDYFTELITPLAVHTAQLIVGTNSQQMDLIGVKFIPNADNDPNYFKSTAGRLEHFTIREDGIAQWQIPASAHRLSNGVAYYVYARCSRSGTTGSILVSERQIKLEEDPGYYHFWIGVLNTPEDNVRSWNPTYGYTEISGQTITTGVIKDKLSRMVIDLINGTISGPVTFTDGSSGLDNVAEWPAAKQDIAAAHDSAVKAKDSVTSLNTYVDGAFKDGIITEAEARAIEKYLNTVKTSKTEVEATYNKLYANQYLSGAAKTGLLNSKVTLFGAIDNLLSSINAAIADGKTTVAEKNDVDSKFTAFNSALASFNSAVETANQTIQDVLKGYSDTAYRKGQDALSAAEAASNAANKAQSSAEGAQGTADSKAKIYYSVMMPQTGKLNDLWVDGVNIYRFNGSTWEFHSLYDAETRINKGLITTGAVAVGPKGNPTGGIAGSGSIRIWAGGGCSAAGIPNEPTFRVLNDGRVYGSNSIVCMDKNYEVTCGFASDGTDYGSIVDPSKATPGSTRIWVGTSYESRDNAPFRVGLSGMVKSPLFMVDGYNYIYNGGAAFMNGGQIVCKSSNGDRIAQLIATPSVFNSVLRLKDISSSGLPSSAMPLIEATCGIAADLTHPRTWIKCDNAGGWGSGFIVESRYFNDANGMRRTVINVGALTRKPHAEKLASGGTWRRVIVNDVTGYLAYED